MSPKKSIVIISGMDPIRAAKLLAATDRRFTSRYAPPPEVPEIKWTPIAAPSASAQPTRGVTAQDIAGLGELELSDFTLDFHDVVLPTEAATEAEIEALCNQIYDRVMAPAGSAAAVS
jgi:type IV secretion system protein VirD4